MSRIGEGQAFTSSDFKKAIYAIRGNNRQTKGMACAIAIEGQREGTVLLVTDTWKDPEPITGCRLHRYSSKKQHFEDYQLKPSRITQRGHFSSVLCDGTDSSFWIKRLRKKCLSGQQLERDFRVYTIYRDECRDLELKYSNGGYNLIDNNLSDLTLCGSPIIHEDNSEKYLVRILTTNDEGKAVPCFLSNGVLEQPAFSTHPKDPQTLREGESITFSSDADGIPEPTFSWIKDESAVTADNRISLSAGNKQLSITNVNRTDSGKYRCVASNRVRTVNSKAATLTVHYQPEFTEHPESRTRREGSSVDFLSDAHGVPEPKFSWIKDGTALAESNRISFLRDKKQLRITGVEKEDSGKYQCVASNKVNDRVTSNPAMLKVEEKEKCECQEVVRPASSECCPFMSLCYSGLAGQPDSETAASSLMGFEEKLQYIPEALTINRIPFEVEMIIQKLDLRKLSANNWYHVARTLGLSVDETDNLKREEYREGGSPTLALLSRITTWESVITLRQFVCVLHQLGRHDVSKLIFDFYRTEEQHVLTGSV